jgi:hypothetical protein
MSHTRVKTTYSVEGAYGSTDTEELYCHHNHSADYTVFYNKDGSRKLIDKEKFKINGNCSVDSDMHRATNVMG